MTISAEISREIISGILFVPALAFSMTLRGFSRALVAKWLGDPTPEDNGFLTFDPTAHVDLLFTALFAAVLTIIDIIIPSSQIALGPKLTAMFLLLPNWSKRVEVNPLNFKNSTLGITISSISGMAGTFLGAVIAAYLIRLVSFASIPTFALEPIILSFILLFHCCIWFTTIQLLPIPEFDMCEIIMNHFPQTHSFFRYMAPPIGSLIFISLMVFNVLSAFAGIMALIVSLFVFI
ncbi:site-2 protease family protein [Candidatus Babeliales bacterium]|nr:site-2 protease family protein [Candidatus Babeliales bacterium]